MCDRIAIPVGSIEWASRSASSPYPRREGGGSRRAPRPRLACERRCYEFGPSISTRIDVPRRGGQDEWVTKRATAYERRGRKAIDLRAGANSGLRFEGPPKTRSLLPSSAIFIDRRVARLSPVRGRVLWVAEVRASERALADEPGIRASRQVSKVHPMRIVCSAIARFALFAIPSSIVASVTGCATSSFGGAAPGYDQQACVEGALRRAPDPETVASARKAFKAECREGGAEACSALGVMNEIGVGVPMNAAQAVVLYERACEAGNARGCVNLGVARAEGIGGPRDAAAGARLLEPACYHGDARACVHLARLYTAGDGVANDPVLAAQLFELACSGDEASACIALGDFRAKAGNLDGAADLYGKACSLGDMTGCKRLDAPRAGSREEVATSDRL